MGTGLQLARRLDEPETFWLAAGMRLYLVAAPQHGEERLRLAEELAAWPRTGVRANVVVMGLTSSASAFLAWGQRGRAEEVWRELDELAQRSWAGPMTLAAITKLRWRSAGSCLSARRKP